MQNKLLEQKKRAQHLAKEWGHAPGVLCARGRTGYGSPGSHPAEPWSTGFKRQENAEIVHKDALGTQLPSTKVLMGSACTRGHFSFLLIDRVGAQNCPWM